LSKTLIGLSIVVSIAILIGHSYAEETKRFTVSGEWIVPESGIPSKYQNVVDIRQTSVVITRAVLNDEGQFENSVLATSVFKDRKVVLEGEIDAPTDVLISVTRGKEEPMELETVLGPGSNTSFALWDRDNSSPNVKDQLLLVEEFRVVGESDSKFTITGDLSSIVDKDLSVAKAYIQVQSSNPKTGSILSDKSNAVFLRDGRFAIEGIAQEPLLVKVWVISYFGVIRDVERYIGVVNAVVEPGAHIRISPSTSSSSFAPGARASELMATSDKESSFHHKVIESWQSSEEYLRKMDEYARAIMFEAQQSQSDSGIEEEQTETEGTKEESINAPYDVHRELSSIRDAFLSSIAGDLKDPMSALLAMELGAGYGITESNQLENWNKFADMLDQDTVARRVVPQIELIEKIR